MRRDEFEEGLEPGLKEALRAHAATPPLAPAGFTATVMQRARRARALASPALLALRDPLPWWVRAAAQPALVLALTLAVLVLRYAALMADAGMMLVSRTAMLLGAAAAPFEQQDPIVQTALLVAFGVMALMASVPLFFWSGSLVRPPRVPRAHRTAS